MLALHHERSMFKTKPSCANATGQGSVCCMDAMWAAASSTLTPHVNPTIKACSVGPKTLTSSIASIMDSCLPPTIRKTFAPHANQNGVQRNVSAPCGSWIDEALEYLLSDRENNEDKNEKREVNKSNSNSCFTSNVPRVRSAASKNGNDPHPPRLTKVSACPTTSRPEPALQSLSFATTTLFQYIW